MDITDSINLTDLNTLGLNSTARRCVRLTELADLTLLRQVLEGSDWFVLGGGSNVVMPKHYAGIIIKPDFKGIELLTSGDAPRIKAYAGENWHDFVGYCLQQGWHGLENLAFIPGTVGAAPIQNIGAYGLEVAQRIESVCIWDIHDQCFKDIMLHDCAFAYRDSVFKQGGLGQVIVVSVTFKLSDILHWKPTLHYAELARAFTASTKSDSVTPKAIYDAIIAIRQSKLPDPKVIGNAGSFFKNPIVSQTTFESMYQAYPNMPHYPQPSKHVKLAAAWLIDQCGLKGQVCGPIGVHQQQALVMVNHAGLGQADASDVLRAMKWIQTEVYERFSVMLEPEPIFV